MNEQAQDSLLSACSVLERAIEGQQQSLDAIQEEIQVLNRNVKVPRQDFDKATPAAALELLKHNLAALQGGIKVLQDHYQGNSFIFLILFFSPFHLALLSFLIVYPENQDVLENIAKISQLESSTQLQELVVQEKTRQKLLRDEIQKYLISFTQSSCLNNHFNNLHFNSGSCWVSGRTKRCLMSLIRKKGIWKTSKKSWKEKKLKTWKRNWPKWRDSTMKWNIIWYNHISLKFNNQHTKFHDNYICRKNRLKHTFLIRKFRDTRACTIYWW